MMKKKKMMWDKEQLCIQAFGSDSNQWSVVYHEIQERKTKNIRYLPNWIVTNAVWSTVTIFADAAILLRWMFASLRLCTLSKCALYIRICKISSRFWFYMTIIHFHIDNFHKLYLCSKLLNFLLNDCNNIFSCVSKSNSSSSSIMRQRWCRNKIKNYLSNSDIMLITIIRWVHPLLRFMECLPSVPHFLDRDQVSLRALNQFHSTRMKRWFHVLSFDCPIDHLDRAVHESLLVRKLMQQWLSLTIVFVQSPRNI